TERGPKGSKKKAVGKSCADMSAHPRRMQYAAYVAKGYPNASGVIEGACRHLVKDRMERAGMHWTPAGAQAMLDVRSTYVNGDWEHYQAYRIQRETQRLYPHRHLAEGPQFCMAALDFVADHWSCPTSARSATAKRGRRSACGASWSTTSTARTKR